MNNNFELENDQLVYIIIMTSFNDSSDIHCFNKFIMLWKIYYNY